MLAPGTPGAAEPWEAHAYVRIAEDGIVTITCHRSEMGQGIRTTMPMIIADEMEADWSRCRVEQALGDACGVCRLAQVVHDDREFVAAEPRDGVAFAHRQNFDAAGFVRRDEDQIGLDPALVGVVLLAGAAGHDQRHRKQQIADRARHDAPSLPKIRSR